MTTTSDEQGIREVITFYADGMCTVVMWRGPESAVFTNRRFFAAISGTTSLPRPLSRSMTGWRRVLPRPPRALRSLCQTLGIGVTGRVATAKVRELTITTGVVIDHFHLLKVGDHWSIVSKLWDAEQS